MKVAVLISGSPRFNQEFDSFVNGLTGCAQVDWFVQSWKYNLPPDKLGYEHLDLVAHSWRTVDESWAKEKLTSILPVTHNLIRLEITDNNYIKYPNIIGPQTHHENFQSICKMHLGWYLVNKLKDSVNNTYDLVIRARPDLMLPEPLNLIDLKNIIDKHPETVIVSNGGQHGYGGNVINDLIGISNDHNISIYTDLVNHVKTYNDQGIMFHPETLLAHHLKRRGLKILPRVKAEIRTKTPVTFGHWQ